MRVKEQVVQNCSKCGRFEKEISPEQWGCDQCRALIEPCGNDERLDVKIFYHDHDRQTGDYYFCSWECVFNFVAKVKSDYFVTLPYISFEHKIKGRRAKDFFEALRVRRGRK